MVRKVSNPLLLSFAEISTLLQTYNFSEIKFL